MVEQRGLYQVLGEGRISESLATIAAKATKAALTGVATANQNDARRALFIPLQTLPIHASLREQPGEGGTDVVVSDAAQEPAGGAQLCQGTANVGWCSAESVVAGTVLRGSRADGTKPIDQGFTAANDVRHACASLPG